VTKDFLKLIQDARAAKIEGWDFSYVEGRMISEVPPWSWREIILPHIKKSSYLLDMGTGGGEFLSSLNPLPEHTYATEAYPPNIPVARKKLEKLGIRVIPVIKHEELPLTSDYFDLVINRHEYYDPLEVHRILKPGGIFITQQVGKQDGIELNQFFNDESYKTASWDVDYSSRELTNNGFKVLDSKETFIREQFKDIGTVVYYLRIIPWQIPGFDIDKNIDRLKELHLKIKEEGAFITRGHRFLIIAKVKKL
jgi:SAM-dependent methyltransferase